MRSARWWPPLIAVAAAGSFTACGAKRVDTGKLETKIKSGIEQQTNVKIRSIDCPQREIRAGDSFTCKATATNGDSANVTVTQQDDKGNMRWRLGS